MSHVNRVQLSASPWWPFGVQRFISLLQASAKEPSCLQPAQPPPNKYTALYAPRKTEKLYSSPNL